VVDIEALAGLAAQVAAADHLPQQRAGTVLRVAGLLVQHVHDGQADVQADKVSQLQGAHGVVGAQLHGGVDALDVGHALHLDEGGLVDHGDQDAVDHEAGCLVDLDRLLADGHRDLLDLLNGLHGGVAAGDDLDQLHAVGGVEEVHTHQRAAQALADLGDGQGRGVGSKDALGLADLVQLGKGGLLDLHVLKGGLHDQVAVRAQVLFDACGDGGADLVGLGLGHLALGDQAVVALGDLGLAVVGPLLLDVAQDNGVALDLRKCLCNALAHGASADNADFHSNFSFMIFYISCCPKAQLLVKTGLGLGFSRERKQAMPSTWSWVSKQSPNSFSSTSTAFSMGREMPSFIAFLQLRTAMGAFLAILPASLRALSISSAWGYTALTR